MYMLTGVTLRITLNIKVILSIEGNLLNEPLLDMKGVNLRKKSLSKRISDRVTQEVLIDEILKPNIKLSNVLKKVDIIEKDVIASLKEGKADYSVPSKCNKADSYKAPYSQMVLRAVENYNALELTELPITLPNKVYVFKLLKDDLSNLVSNGNITQELADKIQNILDSRPEEFSKFGFDVIALPMHETSLPKEIVGLVDYERMCSDAVRSSTTEILEPLGLKVMLEDSKSFVSTIINF